MKIAGVAVTAVLALWMWSGPRPEPADGPVAVPGSPLPATRVLYPTRARIVVAPASRAFGRNPTAYGSEIERWREVLTRIGVVADTVRVAALEANAGTVLIVPLADCVGAAAREAIGDHVEAGGGAILVGSVGERDERCRSGEAGLTRRLTGVEGLQRLESETSHRVVLVRGAPLAAGIPRGYAIDLSPGPLDVADAPRRDARYAPGSDGRGAAALHSRAGAGRVSWIGFPLTAVREWRGQRRVVGLLVRNAVNWAADHSTLHLARRPDLEPAPPDIPYQDTGSRQPM